jgi:acyl dehydratase
MQNFEDLQPFHLDDAVANELFGEGGMTAPGVFIMAVRTLLLHDMPNLAVIAALGYDELRFHAPVRVGDSFDQERTGTESLMRSKPSASRRHRMTCGTTGRRC